MEFVFPWIDTSQKVSTTTKAQVRLEKYTADELLLHGTHPLGFKRYTVHARIYRVSMLHELGANVPIQSRCGASPGPRQLPDGKSIASRVGCWLRSTAQGHWSLSMTV
jgi:hypothetical protein